MHGSESFCNHIRVSTTRCWLFRVPTADCRHYTSSVLRFGAHHTVTCTSARPIKPSDDRWRAAGGKINWVCCAFHSWFRSKATSLQGGTVTREEEWTIRDQWNQTARSQSCLETTSIHCRSLEETTSQFCIVGICSVLGHHGSRVGHGGSAGRSVFCGE